MGLIIIVVAVPVPFLGVKHQLTYNLLTPASSTPPSFLSSNPLSPYFLTALVLITEVFCLFCFYCCNLLTYPVNLRYCKNQSNIT